MPGTQKYQILILLKKVYMERRYLISQYKVLEIYGFKTAEKKKRKEEGMEEGKENGRTGRCRSQTSAARLGPTPEEG